MNKFKLNPGEIFSSGAITENLTGKSVRGGMITMGSTGVMFVINMARTVVLARLLTPEDFGIIGMVAVFIGFIGMFKDAGLSMATVQKDKISEEQISTLAWLNFMISAAMGLILIIGSPLVSLFYDRPELTPVTIALAVSFILGGLTIQHNALLRRHMRFESLAIKTILSTTGGVIISILLALNGWHYWALIAGNISMTIFEILLTFFFCPWFPGPMKRGAGVRSMLKFGAHLTGSSFFNYFSRNADNILIGKFIGAGDLGLYQKAYQLFLLPISNIRNPINQVAIPALSSLQHDPQRYKNYFIKITDILATLSFPVAIYLFFEAGFIIHLMLGDQWTGAIPVFKLLAVGGLIQAVASQRGLAMITSGQSKRFLNWGIFYAIVAVTSFAVGIPFGIEGVAGAYAIAEYVVFIPSLYYCYQNTPINPLSFAKQLIPPLLVSLFAASCMEIIRYLAKGDTILNHILYAVLFGAVYFGITWLRKGFRETAMIFYYEFKNKRK